MKILKSIVAVLAGMIVAIGLSIGTDYILESAGIFTPINVPFVIWWMLLLAIIYRCLYTALGSYIVAVLAPNNAARLVTIFAVLSFAGNLAGLIATWGKGLGPEWYPIALVVLAYPSAKWGGNLRTKKA